MHLKCFIKNQCRAAALPCPTISFASNMRSKKKSVADVNNYLMDGFQLSCYLVSDVFSCVFRGFPLRCGGQCVREFAILGGWKGWLFCINGRGVEDFKSCEHVVLF
jgi:hypothetical protein